MIQAIEIPIHRSIMNSLQCFICIYVGTVSILVSYLIINSGSYCSTSGRY